MTRRRIDTLISSNYYLTPEQRSLFGTLSQDISHKTENTLAKSHQRMLRRAAALCNGLIFMCNPDSTNACLRILKEPLLPLDAFEPPQPNALCATAVGWNPIGLPRAVASRIVEEIYQRTVCPRTYELNQSQVFSDSVRLRRVHTLTHL